MAAAGDQDTLGGVASRILAIADTDLAGALDPRRLEG